MLEIFNYEFMQRALIAGSAVAIVSSLLGVFLVLRRMSLMGDGFSHVALGGVALGMFLSLFLPVSPYWVALGFAVIAAVGVVKLKEIAKIKGDVSIGIIFSFALAMGAILFSISNGFSVDLHYFLFGNIISLGNEDVYAAIGIGAIVLALITAYEKELSFMCFDEISAQIGGVATKNLNLMLVILSAIVVVMSMRIVGILLISSFLIVPPAAAISVARSFKQALVLSVIFGLISVWAGLLASYYFDLASGGSIVMSSIVIFVFCQIYLKISDTKSKLLPN